MWLIRIRNVRSRDPAIMSGTAVSYHHSSFHWYQKLFHTGTSLMCQMVGHANGDYNCITYIENMPLSTFSYAYSVLHWFYKVNYVSRQQSIVVHSKSNMLHHTNSSTLNTKGPNHTLAASGLEPEAIPKYFSRSLVRNLAHFFA